MCIRNKGENRPWFTKSFINACKKKNNLYKKYIKCKTMHANNKYKNKLTNILRYAEKEYYSNLMEKHCSDTKGIWKVMLQFSKILGKLFDNKLEKFMEQNEILSDSQYSFRKKTDLHLWLY